MSVHTIEAVTVCIGYADFLAETVGYNEGLFDRWVIVTSEDDHETREVCRRHSLHCITSSDHTRQGHTFNKGRLVERGLQHLSAGGWRMHLDADIVIPQRMRRVLESADLDERKIYGCDRVMVRNWDQWQKLQRTGWCGHTHHHLVCFPDGFDIGTRWAHHDMGYVPIGFLQLWHSRADQWRGVRSRPYPTRHNDACRTDVQHGLQWDRSQRELLPELVVAHLESEDCRNGTNWKGRKTKRFGPDNCTPALGKCS